MKSKLVLGTWQFGGSFGYWENQNKDKSKAVIKEAIKAGITTFDTAYSYLNTESLLSSLLPTDTAIYTKVQPVPSFERKFKTSLKRLKRDSIDTLFIHWPTDDKALLENSINSLLKLKQEGFIKHIGYSNFALSLLKELPIPDKIERAVSLLWINELKETQEWCSKGKVALVGYSPLAMGILTGKYKNKEDLKDKRQNFYALNHMRELEKLLKEIQNIAVINNVSISQIAISWALAQCDEVVFGAKDVQTLRENLSPLCLKEEEIVYLDKASCVINSFATYDNPLGHIWRTNG